MLYVMGYDETSMYIIYFVQQENALQTDRNWSDLAHTLRAKPQF